MKKLPNKTHTWCSNFNMLFRVWCWQLVPATFKLFRSVKCLKWIDKAFKSVVGFSLWVLTFCWKRLLWGLMLQILFTVHPLMCVSTLRTPKPLDGGFWLADFHTENALYFEPDHMDIKGHFSPDASLHLRQTIDLSADFQISLNVQSKVQSCFFLLSLSLSAIILENCINFL